MSTNKYGSKIFIFTYICTYIQKCDNLFFLTCLVNVKFNNSACLYVLCFLSSQNKQQQRNFELNRNKWKNVNKKQTQLRSHVRTHIFTSIYIYIRVCISPVLVDSVTEWQLITPPIRDNAIFEPMCTHERHITTITSRCGR